RSPSCSPARPVRRTSWTRSRPLPAPGDDVADDVTAPVGPHADAATSPHAGAASRTTREAAPAAGGGARRRGPLSASARKRLEILFFVAPAMALFVVFIVTPVVQAVRYSAFNWNGLGPLDDFVGLQNYKIGRASC